jgi:hypothetical protein
MPGKGSPRPTPSMTPPSPSGSSSPSMPKAGQPPTWTFTRRLWSRAGSWPRPTPVATFLTSAPLCTTSPIPAWNWAGRGAAAHPRGHHHLPGAGRGQLPVPFRVRRRPDLPPRTTHPAAPLRRRAARHRARTASQGGEDRGQSGEDPPGRHREPMRVSAVPRPGDRRQSLPLAVGAPEPQPFLPRLSLAVGAPESDSFLPRHPRFASPDGCPATSAGSSGAPVCPVLPSRPGVPGGDVS